MKLAIISDTHFGDPDSALVTKTGGISMPGPAYQAFKEAAGTGNDYLVLAGDIFDFSIASYEEAYEYASGFFRQVKADGVADVMLYLAGNHDADMWHIIQHQRHVINKVLDGDPPNRYEHAVPAFLDDRERSGYRKIQLYGVAPNQDSEHAYGGMFLDHITKPDTTFYFAYPNFYIIADEGTVLVTHGQYLEGYWSFLGSILPKIVKGAALDNADLDAELKAILARDDIRGMATMNYPLNQLACTGVGQSGPVRSIARIFEKAVSAGSFAKAQAYIAGAADFLVDSLMGQGFSAKQPEKAILDAIIGALCQKFASAKPARYDQDFLSRPEVRERFYRFYAECLQELAGIGVGIPAPKTIIFGHTHDPIPLGNNRLFVPASPSEKPSLHLYNAGGWLKVGADGKESFHGAVVFRYETGKGFSSTSIEYANGAFSARGDAKAGRTLARGRGLAGDRAMRGTRP